ncbi:hypothetical protein LTR29_010390 [Friedmanniomyces endolithicus]|nr:hypothetical protein LTR29_010390 [Friedmanniomyces endolithicus]
MHGLTPHDVDTQFKPTNTFNVPEQFSTAIAAAILAFVSVQVLAAPVPQLAGEGAASNSILSATDNGIGYGTENAENNLAGNVASVKAGQIPSKRQLAGEGAAANSVLSSTDNGVGFGVENAEVNLAGDVTAVKAGQIPKRQADKICKGAQVLSTAAGTGALTNNPVNSCVGIDGVTTSGAANTGAAVGATEQGTLEDAGSAVPKARREEVAEIAAPKPKRQADKICKGAQVLSTAAGTGGLTNNPVNSCVGIDGVTTSGAADTGAAVGATEQGTLEDAGSAVPKL